MSTKSWPWATWTVITVSNIRRMLESFEIYKSWVQIYTFYKALLLYKCVEILTFDEIFCNCAREDVGGATFSQGKATRWFTRRAGAVRFLVAGELSRSFSLSQTSSLSLSLSDSQVGIWFLNPFSFFFFWFREGENDVVPLNVFFFFPKFFF